MQGNNLVANYVVTGSQASGDGRGVRECILNQLVSGPDVTADEAFLAELGPAKCRGGICTKMLLVIWGRSKRPYYLPA
jgi:hypothetical protein